MEKHQVLISLASNHNQQKNLCEARRALAQVLSGETYTEELWTEPEGKAAASGHRYLNQLVKANTLLDSQQLTERLKQMEQALGRTDDMRRQGIVPIDLDLLLHDGQRFHQRDWQRNYVRLLLQSMETP